MVTKSVGLGIGIAANPVPSSSGMCSSILVGTVIGYVSPVLG